MKYFIFSVSDKEWWRLEGGGLCESILDAGVYTEERARSICAAKKNGRFSKVAVDAAFMLRIERESLMEELCQLHKLAVDDRDNEEIIPKLAGISERCKKFARFKTELSS